LRFSFQENELIEVPMSDFWRRWQQIDSAQNAASKPSMPLEHRWSSYYQAVVGRPPRETLIYALNLFETEPLPDQPRPFRFAVDLGCGNGRDTAELRRRGWRVLAIDGQEDAIASLRQRPDINRTYLETRVQSFETLTLPPAVDLINASFCLPFCPAEHFPELWDVILTALKPGGRFCGHLFGERDSWASFSNVLTHTRAQVEQLLQSLTVEWLDEEEHPGKTALGEDKYWHLFNIVACNR
jgi:SAM-dependent methyltransferase